MIREWNVLYVKRNHEKAASRFLAAHGADHYLPLYVEREAIGLDEQPQSHCRDVTYYSCLA
jgi:hypothetical protein